MFFFSFWGFCINFRFEDEHNEKKEKRKKNEEEEGKVEWEK